MGVGGVSVTVKGKAWEPEIRYSQAGNCIANVSVSVYDGKDQEGKAKYYSVTVKAFKELAESVGNEIQKGDNIIAVGRLSGESWQDKDGNKKSKLVLIAEDIGKNIRFNKQAGNSGNVDINSFGSEVFPDEQIPF